MVAKSPPKRQDRVRFFVGAQRKRMNYETCRIGQLCRCNETGCEWKKSFGGYCWLRPSKIESDFIKSKEKKDKRNEIDKQNPTPILVKEFTSENVFSVPKQEEWIKKIKVKL